MGSEPEGFKAFFENQWPKVVSSLIYYHRFPHQIAEDAASRAMVRLLLDWSKVQSPKAWLRTVAVREAVRLAQQQHAALPDTDLADERAEAELDAVELALMVGAALKTLPPKQQKVMALTIADMKPEEIADELGCTAEQARGNLAHARRALRRALGTEEEA
ncbi:RNA polymerase sigma factor [Streptomyces chartreusis]